MFHTQNSMLRRVAAVAVAGVAGVGLALGTTLLPAQATPNEQVCAPLDSGKTDVTGDHKTVTVDASEGFLISGYCVKAGSIKQGLGPEAVTLNDPVSSLMIAHSSGKDISHYSLSYVAVPVVEEPPVEPPYVQPVLNCGEGTVPGWLNEQGDPTSCVGDNPCPEVDFGETCPVDVVEPIDPPVVDVPEEPTETVEPVTPTVPLEPVDMGQLPTLPVTELAYTGSPSPLIPAGFASLLLAVGAFLVRKAVSA